jgi:hypothetical protein
MPSVRLGPARARSRRSTRRRAHPHGCSSASLPAVTNIPFAPEEAVHFIRGPAGGPPPEITPRLRTALRVDPILAADWVGICAALKRSALPYEPTIGGCRAYLQHWVKRVKPLYLMASTPPGFKYTPSQRSRKRDADGEPAPAPSQGGASGPSATDLLEKVLLRVAAEERLPIALKIGAVRGVNPALRTGGDGVEVADLSCVRNLCTAYPSVKFLVTVLSADNQHELCVLARKFGNLHVYGCWWFCNNPSIIEATTAMRLEMLGSAFTCQHSDARVLDQLLYKWKHSREAIAPVLAAQYRKLIQAGWAVSEDDVRKDVQLLFGGAFEAFLAK